MNSIRSFLVSRGILHKGESLSHIFYLSFAFIEGHGMHAIGAGLVVAFMAVSYLLHLGVSE
jgi:hypothetical protein